MKQITLLTIFLMIIISCSSQPKNESTFQRIIINPDSCKAWNMPEVEFAVDVPNGYKLEFNVPGGFYFQAQKLDDSRGIISEISFGKLEGRIDEKEFPNLLAESSVAMNNEFKQLKQDYRLLSISELLINDKIYCVAQSYLDANMEGVIVGEYNASFIPIVLSKGGVLFSCVTQHNDPKDNKNRLPILVNDIIKSLK